MVLNYYSNKIYYMILVLNYVAFLNFNIVKDIFYPIIDIKDDI